MLNDIESKEESFNEDPYEKQEDALRQTTLNQQKRSGELEVVEEPETNETETEETEGTSEKTDTEETVQESDVDIDGQRFTKSELKERLAELEQIKSSKLQAHYTQSRQELSQKTKDFVDTLEKLKTEYAGDEGLVKVLDVLQETKSELEELKGKQKGIEEQSQYQRDRELVEKAVREVEKKYNVKLPDLDSREMKPYLDIAQNMNRMEAAYLLMNSNKGTKEKKEPQKMLQSKSDPRSDTVDSDLRSRIMTKGKKWMKPGELSMLEKMIE